MSCVLVVGLSEKGAIHPASFECVGAGLSVAKRLEVPAYAVVLGHGGGSDSQFPCAGLAGVFTATATSPFHVVAEHQVAVLTQLVTRLAATVVIAPHTLDTAEWAPLLAAKSGAVVLTDVQKLERETDHWLVTRKVCGGALTADYEVDLAPLVVTLSPGAHPPANGEQGPTTTVEVPEESYGVEVVEERVDGGAAGPALKQARVVVAGGMGLGGPNNWNLIAEAARALGGAEGATRAAVDAGWALPNQQVGYSGAKVAPDLYLAIGISGAVHHLAGIAQAKTVVAVNSDPNADIFKVARLGVVGDAKEVLPAFTSRVRELLSGDAA